LVASAAAADTPTGTVLVLIICSLQNLPCCAQINRQAMKFKVRAGSALRTSLD